MPLLAELFNVHSVKGGNMPSGALTPDVRAAGCFNLFSLGCGLLPMRQNGANQSQNMSAPPYKSHAAVRRTCKSKHLRYRRKPYTAVYDAR